MSIWATGSVEITFKRTPSKKNLKYIEENFEFYKCEGKTCSFGFDGNVYLDNLVSDLNEIKDIKKGYAMYHCDDGEAYLTYSNGAWCEEWQETYYPSRLPNEYVCDTSRIKEIMGKVNNIINLSQNILSSGLIKQIFEPLKLTDEEIKLYGMEWMK